MKACTRLCLVVLLSLGIMLVSGAVWAQVTPADAVAEAVANAGVFPAGTTVVSVAVDGASITVDLSPEAAPFDLSDVAADEMVKAICNAVGDFPEFTSIEVTVAGTPLWQYLPASTAPDAAAPAEGSSAMSIDDGGFSGVMSAQDPLLPPVVSPQSGELSGKLVVLHPSHGAYAGTSAWYRAMRTFCGPGPRTAPFPPGTSQYQPSDYYYWTMGFTWPAYYEDDYSPETIRFLYAYCQAAGAATFCSRNLDKTAGLFPWAEYGYPNPGFTLPKWMTAAKYYLQDRGDVPSWVWNTSDVSSQSDKDLRARSYYANYLMESLGYNKDNSVSFSLHSNAANTGQAPNYQAQARGTETYWYTSKYPELRTQAIAYANAVESALISAIRTQYDGTWAEPMYNAVATPVPPEWYTPYGTYRGYVQNGTSLNRWQDRGVKTSNFGEIRECKMPAQLMELLFHDDWKFYPDEAFHSDQIFRATVAWGMYTGICNYFGVTPKPYYGAAVDGVSFPAFVKAGTLFSGSVSMKNEGMAWCWGNKWADYVYSPYTVWNLSPTVNDQFGAAGTKIAIANDGIYYTGDTAAFSVSLTAPAASGYYTTEWQMLKDDKGAFGAVASAQIGVDGDAPVITVASPAAQDYLRCGNLAIGFSAEDAMSGVASLSATLDGNAVNSGDTFGLLWASLGEHTLVVNSADNVGNAGSQTVTFNVIATIESMIAAVNELYAAGQIDNEGIQTSLLAKLAKYEKDTGDIPNAKNYLNNFINEVEAQSGQHMTVAAANLLLENAYYCIAHLPVQ